jgi:predicted nucleotidyltransferase
MAGDGDCLILRYCGIHKAMIGNSISWGAFMSATAHLSQLLTEITDKFPSIQVMYLFGSHAAGTNRADSDVDIAVFTDGSESPLMDLELGAFLQQQLKRAVDVVVLQKASPILQHEVLRNKIRLFEKSGINRAFLENKSLRAYLDARHYQHLRALWRKSNDKNAGH